MEGYFIYAVALSLSSVAHSWSPFSAESRYFPFNPYQFNVNGPSSESGHVNSLPVTTVATDFPLPSPARGHDAQQYTPGAHFTPPNVLMNAMSPLDPERSGHLLPQLPPVYNNYNPFIFNNARHFAAPTTHVNESNCRCMPVNMCRQNIHPMDAMFQNPFFAPSSHRHYVNSVSYRAFDADERKQKYLKLKNAPPRGEENQNSDNSTEARAKDHSTSNKCNVDEICCTVASVPFHREMRPMMPPVPLFTSPHTVNPYYAYAYAPTDGMRGRSSHVYPSAGGVYDGRASSPYAPPFIPNYAPQSTVKFDDDRSRSASDTRNLSENNPNPVPTMTREVRHNSPHTYHTTFPFHYHRS